jgi:hypothetical protein
MPQNTKWNSSDGSGQNSRMAKHKQTIYQHIKNQIYFISILKKEKETRGKVVHQ